MHRARDGAALKAALDEVFKLQPANGEILIDQGRAHLMKGDAQATERDFTRTIEPSDPHVDGYVPVPGAPGPRQS